ncbi:hypothetical protein FACS1894200_05410 [Spirochaetia bacterium]|nr:hypothetical protein FACS1894200_05410 [Spirochaetia bacterium]
MLQKMKQTKKSIPVSVLNWPTEVFDDPYAVEVYDDENTNTKEKGKVRLIHEDLLKRLPPDILRELARRRLEEIKAGGYDIEVAVTVEQAVTTAQ